jgi:hypothetical protein
MSRGWVGVGRLFLFTLLFGCTSENAELCELASECSSPNDNDLDACVIALDTEAEVASVRDCEEEWDALVDCAIEQGHCEDGRFRAGACNAVRDAYGECLG